MFLDRFKISIDHFSKTEIDAQAKALAITTQIKNLLASKEAVTVEGLTGTQDLGAATLDLLTQGIAILQSTTVSASITAVEDNLGDLGARLTAAIHEGQPIVSGIFHWIYVFESLFHLGKNKA